MSDNYSQERRDPQRRKKAKGQEAALKQRSVRQQRPVQGQNNKRQQSPAREQQLTEEQIERRRRRREAARRKREQQVRTRLAVLAVIIVFALAGIGALAFRIHKRNVLEEQAALAASLEIQRQQEEAALTHRKGHAAEEHEGCLGENGPLGDFPQLVHQGFGIEAVLPELGHIRANILFFEENMLILQSVLL